MFCLNSCFLSFVKIAVFYKISGQGIFLRVRLTPNSSACLIKGVFTDALGQDFLKINVVSVPEKGKANQELITFLAKNLKIPKNKIQIVSGETDRYKKLWLDDNSQMVLNLLQKWAEKEEK